jgi:hypothetical protein
MKGYNPQLMIPRIPWSIPLDLKSLMRTMINKTSEATEIIRDKANHRIPMAPSFYLMIQDEKN